MSSFKSSLVVAFYPPSLRLLVLEATVLNRLDELWYGGFYIILRPLRTMFTQVRSLTAAWTRQIEVRMKTLVLRANTTNRRNKASPAGPRPSLIFLLGGGTAGLISAGMLVIRGSRKK